MFLMSDMESRQQPGQNNPKDLNKHSALEANSKGFKETKYQREKYILDKFERHLETNYQRGKNGKTKNFFSAMIAVLQSSGYGKSKLMERFGSRTPTFYSSLQDGTGYPLATFLLRRLIKELDMIISDGIR
jgi:hypothetical protein